MNTSSSTSAKSTAASGIKSKKFSKTALTGTSDTDDMHTTVNCAVCEQAIVNGKDEALFFVLSIYDGLHAIVGFTETALGYLLLNFNV